MKKVITSLAVLVVIVVVGYFYSPYLSVNGSVISRADMEKRFEASRAAGQKFHEMYPNLSSGDPELVALDAAVTNELIREELLKAIDPHTLDSLLESKINSVVAAAGFDEAAQDIYGLNLADAKKIILAPQAEEDILRSEFRLKDRKFEDWLAEAKKSAMVQIYSRGFRWDGEAVRRSN